MKRLLTFASILFLPFLVAGCATGDDSGTWVLKSQVTCPCGYVSTFDGGDGVDSYQCRGCGEIVRRFTCDKCPRKFYGLDAGAMCLCGNEYIIVMCPVSLCGASGQYIVTSSTRYVCRDGHAFQMGYCGSCKRWQKLDDKAPLTCVCGAKLFANRQQARDGVTRPASRPAPLPAPPGNLNEALTAAWNRFYRDGAAAAADFDAVANRWPDSAEARFQRAQFFLEAGDKYASGAAAEFLAAAGKGGGHPQARVMVALIRADEGKPADAVAELELHLKQVPGDMFALVMAAGFDAMAGNASASERRIQAWREASLEGGRIFPRLDLTTKLAKKSYAAAVQAAATLIGRDADAAGRQPGGGENDAALVLAQELVVLHQDPNRGRVPEADEEVRKLVGRLSGFYQGLRRFDAAAGCWSDVLKWHPNDVQALGNRGVLRKLAGDRAGALADLDRAVTLSGAHSWVFFQRGELRTETGDLQKAADDFAKAVSTNADWWGVAPDHARASLAGCQVRLGRAAEALRTVESIDVAALADKSLAASVHDLAGWILFELDRHADAVRRFEKCLDLKLPGFDADCWAGIACARLRSGDRKAAEEAMAKALKAEPRLKGRRAELLGEGAWFTKKQEAAMDELTR